MELLYHTSLTDNGPLCLSIYSSWVKPDWFIRTPSSDPALRACKFCSREHLKNPAWSFMEYVCQYANMGRYTKLAPLTECQTRRSFLQDLKNSVWPIIFKCSQIHCAIRDKWCLKSNKTIKFDIKSLENNTVLLRKFNTGIPANINYQLFINQNHKSKS